MSLSCLPTLHPTRESVQTLSRLAAFVTLLPFVVLQPAVIISGARTTKSSVEVCSNPGNYFLAVPQAGHQRCFGRAEPGKIATEAIVRSSNAL
jgi:hypothetical protein